MTLNTLSLCAEFSIDTFSQNVHTWLMVHSEQPAKPEQQNNTIAVRVRDVSPRVWEEARIAALRARQHMGVWLSEVLAKHLNVSLD